MAVLTMLWLPGRATPQSLPPAGSGSTNTPDDESASLKRVPGDIVADQKAIWRFPFQAARGKHWKLALGVIGVTAGLVALDPSDAPYFRRTSSFDQFNRVMSSRNTAIGMAALPASFYAFGLARRKFHASRTALLAGEAVVDGEILTVVMKDISRRLKPVMISPGGDFSDTWFRAGAQGIGGYGSFPSQHATVAFSVATVFAERYRSHRWAPWLAYGLAGVVGFSRVPLSAHFPSDVFMGAALGYSISHYAVLGR
ncbi:MAG TPA: phosphatase PAP2 family protein [Bryobacterales bacterium]|nr:phosphatase PAP2 family protein [Bryobacterales bacterium]